VRSVVMSNVMSSTGLIASIFSALRFVPLLVGCIQKNVSFHFQFPTNEESCGVSPSGPVRFGSE
jgi:hypothetical protein